MTFRVQKGGKNIVLLSTKWSAKFFGPFLSALHSNNRKREGVYLGLYSGSATLEYYYWVSGIMFNPHTHTSSWDRWCG